MEDQSQDCNPSAKHASENKNEPDRPEPVRSRWTPKPEQILILESIFNSGMVNPPKDETVRIRKLLEKFGSVGDANVFYWFQNRRSRSRRRQRQIQANLSEEQKQQQQQQASQATRSEILGFGYDGVGGSTVIHYGSGSSRGGLGGGFAAAASVAVPSMAFPLSATSTCLVGSSSSSSSGCGVLGNDCGDGIFSFSGQMGQQQIQQNSSLTNSTFTPSETIDFQYQSGLMTVFINGVATDVPRGPLDLKAMLGQDYMLVHSSGMPLPVNDYGFLTQSLHHGESYFVVPRPF